MTVLATRVAKFSARNELSPTGWIAEPDLPYEEWVRQGTRLGLAGRSAAWWIGDWARYGTARYGGKYTAPCRITGYDRQTIMNMVYVATRFEISRRREKLFWSHHAEVASMEVAEQEYWLNRATAERLSVHDLREELQLNCPGRGRPGRRNATNGRTRSSSPLTRDDEVQSAAQDSSESADTSSETIVCPHCGTAFTP